MAEEFFENVRIPFIVQKYEDKAIVIPKELYMDFSTGKMYVKSIDGATEIEVGRKTIENTIKVEIEKLIGKSTSNGNTLRKLQNIVEPLKLWKEQMDSIGYLSVSTIAEILDVFKDMEETAPTLFAQLQYKVDKVQGLELSDNDFTNTLFNKLMGIENEANLYTHPEVQACNYVAPISLVNGRTGDVVITKEELGLGNVQAGAKKYVHPRDKQCTAASIDSVQIGGDTPKTGIVTLNKASFYLDKVVNNTLITEAEIAATTDGTLPANKYCTPHTFNLYLQKLKTLGKFDETQYKYVPKTVNLTINTTPSDATVKVIYDNTIYNGKTHTLKSKTGYVVVVEKAGYYKYEKYHYLNSDTDTVINVTLQEIVYQYEINLSRVYNGATYTITIKDSSNTVVETKNVTGGTDVNILIKGTKKPGTYTFTINGSYLGIPTINSPGTFTIIDKNITFEHYTYFYSKNLIYRFFKDGVQLTDRSSTGGMWNILIYDPGNSKVTAGWRHFMFAGDLAQKVIINKTGYKYAYIPQKYLYNSGGNMVVSNITAALADKETIIRDIDTAQTNFTFIGEQANIKDIIIPTDPCSQITYSTTFGWANYYVGIYGNGRCEHPVLRTITDRQLYEMLGIPIQSSSTREFWAFNCDSPLRAFKARLNNRDVYMKSEVTLCNISYKYLEDNGFVTNSVMSNGGKHFTINGTKFKLKMYLGNYDAGAGPGGDISPIIDLLKTIPENLYVPIRNMYEVMAGGAKYVGGAVICGDYDALIPPDYKNSYCVQRGGLHGLYSHEMSRENIPSVIDPTSRKPLAQINTWSSYSGFWFYIEEV